MQNQTHFTSFNESLSKNNGELFFIVKNFIRECF
jgi:hypothetical protein